MQVMMLFFDTEVAENHADDERDSDRDREGDGESSHVDCSNEKKVREIKDGAANHHVNNVLGVGGTDVVQETRSVVASASHGEREDQRHEKNTDGVVPVKQLEAIILDALVGIGPGAPANGARNHHDECNSETVGCEHRFSLGHFNLDSGRRSECTCPKFYLPRILETNSCRKRLASTSTHTFALGSTLSTPSMM